MLVQVLDDSDDVDVQHLIKAEVQKWQQKGVKILYRHRLIRTGYKAGNLKSAMSCDYIKDYEFVAIFDADFQPAPDFLKKTIPHFMVFFYPTEEEVAHIFLCDDEMHRLRAWTQAVWDSWINISNKSGTFDLCVSLAKILLFISKKKSLSSLMFMLLTCANYISWRAFILSERKQLYFPFVIIGKKSPIFFSNIDS